MLCKRHGDHKSHYKYWKKTNNNYVTSFNIVQYDDCDIILLENYSCQNKNELHARERHWIEQLNCVNKIVPTRTQKEYREDNIDQIKEYDNNRHHNERKNNEQYQEKVKEYREQNKEKKTESDKKYYNNNKEKIKETVAEYRSENKEKIAEINKTYRENNKEKIAEINKIYQNRPEVKKKNKERLKKYREKITCDICNCEIARDSINKHNISKKHINNTQKLL